MNKFLYKKFSSVLKPKSIQYHKLVDPSIDLSEELDSMIGENSSGIFCIKGVPNLQSLKEDLLLNLFNLCKFSDVKLNEIRSSLEGAVGFSDKPFYSKSGVLNNKVKSFTARFPKETVDDFSEEVRNLNKNLWPSFMPNFKDKYIDFSRLIYNSQFHILRNLDLYSKKKVPESKLFETFYNSITCTNRSVVYQPISKYENLDPNINCWDDWHTDFSLFTNITHPVYITENGNIINGDTCLIIRNRQEKELEVISEPDDLICFMGDTIYMLSGGAIKCTPHIVQHNNKMRKDVYRLNFVSFYEPYNTQKIEIPGKMTFDKLLENDKVNWSLRTSDNFTQGMTYGEYTNQAKEELKIN